MVLRHDLQLDALVAGQASIFGRGTNNPTDPNNDTFNIFARSGVANCSFIALRGPTSPYNANGIDLVAGTKIYQFNSNGNLYTPGSVVLPLDTGIFLGTSSIAKYGPNLFFNLNADWRMYAVETTGWWYWQGYPNFDTKMYLTDVGSLWLKNRLFVGEYGIVYALSGGNATIAFGWNGNVNCYANGSYVGDAALVSWVTGNFKNVSTYTPNQVVDINTGPNFASIMLGGGFFYVAGNYNYYFGRNPGDGSWWIVDNGVINFSYNAGNLNINGLLACQATGVRYVNVGNNGFNFRWDSSNMFARIDNAVEFAIQPQSDERLKSDIVPATFDCIDAVKKTPLFQFRWRKMDTQNKDSLFLETDEESAFAPIGFVAQRQHEVFPESVIKGSDAIGDGVEGATTLWSMDANTLIATMYGAMKEMIARIETLEANLPPGAN